jgi:hypothetical protein
VGAEGRQRSTIACQEDKYRQVWSMFQIACFEHACATVHVVCPSFRPH